MRATLLKSQSGFTLIEVMVALAILAVVAVAASRASSAYLNSVDTLRTRTLAHFVAQNVAADLRIQQTVIKSASTQTILSQGREWQVVMTTSATLSPGLTAVNISIAPITDGQARAPVTDINVLVSDPEQATGSVELTSASYRHFSHSANYFNSDKDEHWQGQS